MDKAELLALAEKAEQRFAGLLDDIPAEKWCYQPFPGANHALWTVGHLAVVNRRVTGLLTGQPPAGDERFGALFGKGTSPQPDVAAYPAPAEVLAEAAAARAGWLDAIRSAPDARLADATPEMVRPFAPTYGTLVAAIAGHTQFHAGQLAMIRKALGLAPKFA